MTQQLAFVPDDAEVEALHAMTAIYTRDLPGCRERGSRPRQVAAHAAQLVRRLPVP